VNKLSIAIGYSTKWSTNSEK